MGKARSLIIITAAALVACSADPPAPPRETATFACYVDGNPTLIVEAVDITLHSTMVKGAMVDHWTVELPGSDIRGINLLYHDAGPHEVCGPETPPPPMVD